ASVRGSFATRLRLSSRYRARSFSARVIWGGKALVHITCRFRIPAQIRGRTQRREKHRRANHPLDGHRVVTTATRGSPALMRPRDHRERAGLGAHGPPRGRRTPHEMLFGDAVSTTSIDL